MRILLLLENRLVPGNSHRPRLTDYPVEIRGSRTLEDTQPRNQRSVEICQLHRPPRLRRSKRPRIQTVSRATAHRQGDTSFSTCSANQALFALGQTSSVAHRIKIKMGTLPAFQRGI